MTLVRRGDKLVRIEPPQFELSFDEIEHFSERVLGHVIAGVEGTYDRHSYADEKRDALEKLAEMVERILNPLPATVTMLAERRSKAPR